MTFYYIRSLIHRSLIKLHRVAWEYSAAISLASSSKHIVQIVQLLEERRMSFSICLNKDHLLLLAGFALFYRDLALDLKGKVVQPNRDLIRYTVANLKQRQASGTMEFGRIADSLIQSKGSFVKLQSNGKVLQRMKSENVPPNLNNDNKKPSQMHLWIPASRPTTNTLSLPLNEDAARMPVTSNEFLLDDYDWQSKPPSRLECEPWHGLQPASTLDQLASESLLDHMPNLDYLSFENEEPSDLNFDPSNSDGLRSSSESDRQTELLMSSNHKLGKTGRFPRA